MPIHSDLFTSGEMQIVIYYHTEEAKKTLSISTERDNKRNLS